MTNLSNIMKTAWAIFRRQLGTFSMALRAAWAAHKGGEYVYEIAATDADRAVTHYFGAAASYDEVRAMRIKKQHDLLAMGLRSMGSAEYNTRFMGA